MGTHKYHRINMVLLRPIYFFNENKCLKIGVFQLICPKNKSGLVGWKIKWREYHFFFFQNGNKIAGQAQKTRVDLSVWLVETHLLLSRLNLIFNVV